MGVVLCGSIAFISLCLLAVGAVAVVLGGPHDRATGFKAIALGLAGLGVFVVGSLIGGAPL